MPIRLINNHPRKTFRRKWLQRLARKISTGLNFRKEAELNFLFTTNREIIRLHQKFFKKRTPTDVITFTDGGRVDIAISLDQAWRQAKPLRLTLSQEIALLICHSLLHAKGYNDIILKDRIIMRCKEFEILMPLL